MMRYEAAISHELRTSAPLTHRDLVQRLGQDDRQAFERVGEALSALARTGRVCRALRTREGRRQFYYYWLEEPTPCAALKVSGLTDIQRQHLAWRLDHKTVCGYITAGRIARGEILQGRTLVEIFEWAGKSPHAAKIHACKVLHFAQPSG